MISQWAEGKLVKNKQFTAITISIDYCSVESKAPYYDRVNRFHTRTVGVKKRNVNDIKYYSFTCLYTWSQWYRINGCFTHKCKLWIVIVDAFSPFFSIFCWGFLRYSRLSRNQTSQTQSWLFFWLLLSQYFHPFVCRMPFVHSFFGL